MISVTRIRGKIVVGVNVPPEHPGFVCVYGRDPSKVDWSATLVAMFKPGCTRQLNQCVQAMLKDGYTVVMQVREAKVTGKTEFETEIAP